MVSYKTKGRLFIGMMLQGDSGHPTGYIFVGVLLLLKFRKGDRNEKT